MADGDQRGVGDLLARLLAEAEAQTSLLEEALGHLAAIESDVRFIEDRLADRNGT